MTIDLDMLPGDAVAGLPAALAALPGSYDGPDGEREAPYGLSAFGEAATAAAIARPWVDGPVVASGTQFLLAGGFEFGDLGPLSALAEAAGARVVRLGRAVHEPALAVDAGPLSTYAYVGYLAHATGRHEAFRRADAALARIRDVTLPDVPTERNPAKRLAWALWNRVPVAFARRDLAGLAGVAQRVLGRTGKALAIAAPEHPLEMLAGALEGNHAFGDDLVALRLGRGDAETDLAAEVLGTRAAQVEALDPAEWGADDPGDPGAEMLAAWYALLWSASYLALLSGQEPEDHAVYEAVRREADGA